MCIPILKIPVKGFIKQGDTIPKVTVKFSDGYNGNLTTAVVKMQIYNGNTKIIDVESGNGITVRDETSFDIDEIDNNTLPVGSFLGDLEVTESNGDRTTYFNVEYTIIKQYTI